MFEDVCVLFVVYRVMLQMLLLCVLFVHSCVMLYGSFWGVLFVFVCACVCVFGCNVFVDVVCG